MKLSDKWFVAFSENEREEMIVIKGRDDLEAFQACGKLKERVEITWKYQPSAQDLPSEEDANRMEKDKLAILTGIYTGGGEKVWVFYTRTVRVFGERLNEALSTFDLLPITIYTELDPEWEEYADMCEMKTWAMDK